MAKPKSIGSIEPSFIASIFTLPVDGATNLNHRVCSTLKLNNVPEILRERVLASFSDMIADP